MLLRTAKRKSVVLPISEDKSSDSEELGKISQYQGASKYGGKAKNSHQTKVQKATRRKTVRIISWK